MLSKSDTDISSIIKLFNSYGLRSSFIVPTETGLKKSIMDAAINIRDYFKENNIHDYELQKTGPENKVVLDGYFIGINELSKTKISLYRPNTKTGDPRIWFSGLNQYASPYNLLAIFLHQKSLYIANVSNKELINSLDDSNSTFKKIIDSASTSINDNAQELLGKLKEINKLGFCESVTDGDTGVGATLESLLGIEINSSKKPDYKGIEIKSSRHAPKRSKSKNRVNLFGQVPDWKLSPIGSAINLLKTYGYRDKDDILRLAVTLEAKRPNRQDLMLKTDIDRDILLTIFKKNEIEKEILIWTFKLLKERLLQKHAESFWVKADYKVDSNKEFFNYYQVVHTEKPFAENLPILFEDGIITLDFTMKQKTGNTVRDHGYLFKVWPESFDYIFPKQKIYDLTS